MNFLSIQIGELIKKRVEDLALDPLRVTNFMKCSQQEIDLMYVSNDLSVEHLLKWSKLLEHDFFRIYSHHLMLYSPNQKKQTEDSSIKAALPSFRKNLYSDEIISFIIELIDTKAKTKAEIIEEYRIPKTTLYKWIQKRKMI